MATEELHGINQAPAPAPSSLPPYQEMILAAIEALNEEGGSNKSAISKHIAQFIETNYGPIPPAHSALLSHHLNKMKSSGQLHFIKNNYIIPDPNSPPRRGRGRPPKPKAPLPPGTVPLSPRPRGRPPKALDLIAPPKPKTISNVTGRKRGRPPKSAAADGGAAAPPPTASGGAPRGRRRPPKVKPAVAVTAPVGA